MHYAAAFLELAERARSHADALAERASGSVGVLSASDSEGELEARVKSTAAASSGAQWRYGGNYSPQQHGQWRMKNGAWNFGNDRRIEV